MEISLNINHQEMKTSSKVDSAIKECLAKLCFLFPAFFFSIFKKLVFMLKNKVGALNLNYDSFFSHY